MKHRLVAKKLRNISKMKIVIFLMLFAFSFLAFIFIRNTWISSINKTSQHALKLTQTIETSLNGEMLKKLQAKPEDIGTAYESIKTRLMDLTKINPDFHYAYIYAVRDGTVYYMADSESTSSAIYSPPGQAYKGANTEVKSAFEDGNARITKPFTDRFGTWVSILVPTKDLETGKVIAVFGMDYPEAMWINEAVFHTLQVGVIALFLILLLIAFYLLVNQNVKLRQEKDFTQAIFESIPGYLYVYDETGKLLRWNKKHEQVTGYTAEELSNMTLDDWYEGEDVMKVAAAVNDVFKTGYGEVEAHLLLKGGSKLHIFSNGVRFRVGGKTYFTGVGMDITERKKAEAALIESESRFRQVAERSRTIAWELDTNGLYTYVSHVAKEVWGYDPEEIIGKMHFYDLHPKQSREAFKREAFECFKSRRPFDNIESPIQTKDGQLIWISTNGIPMLKADGTLKGYCGSDTDITERKRAGDALKESEEKYRLLTEFASDVIWVLNLTSYRFTYYSPSIVHLRGLTPEEAMQESLEDCLTPDSLQVVQRAIARNVKEFLENPISPNYYMDEIQQPCKDGTIIWVEVSTKYRYNAAGEIEIIGVSRNIEERKKSEEQVLHLSYHDQLTGLYNRRFYEEELKRLDQARNYPITLVMADVNGLKLTNDAFGHQAGDLLLVKIANILKNECRADEIVARIGGDEFVFLLPGTDAKDASKIIERIHNKIANEKADRAILSVSIGFAVKQDPVIGMNETFKQAEDDMYRHKLSESSSMRSKTIDLIMNSLYEKNQREMNHSKRVSALCEAIACKMNLDQDEVNQIRIAGLMHDIGKIGIADQILNKIEALNGDEWHETMRHSEIGYRILSSANEFSKIANFVLEHHERWDGKGYPKGLIEESISLQARIIAVADAFDAMTSDRSYRTALSEDEAMQEIKRCSGIQLDPIVAKVFVEKVMGREWTERIDDTK